MVFWILFLPLHLLFSCQFRGVTRYSVTRTRQDRFDSNFNRATMSTTDRGFNRLLLWGNEMTLTFVRTASIVR